MSLENPTFIEKVIANWKSIGIGLLVLLVLFIIVYFWGAARGREVADSEYLQDREQRIGQIAVLKDEAFKLGIENEKLRAQNEAQAEILIKNDALIAGDAKKFTQLQEERDKKENEIKDASDVDTKLGLCNDAKRAGFNLSFCK